ncbi:hypothetical protein SCOR_15255 [Sulfidibacter corallicola]|uniref:Core-binding (CB) domain-containing protein n=1 Tax=Sulfidibacter corallicola TaxID=2818388 RepID=A0A8A4TYL2_SULCO|nr:hypothetical protein [Sulfidibacter corallicola]QTD54174.1 hypothetical protein J3U87_17145 [Sulfidibacter corallicola]
MTTQAKTNAATIQSKTNPATNQAKTQPPKTKPVKAAQTKAKQTASPKPEKAAEPTKGNPTPDNTLLKCWVPFSRDYLRKERQCGEATLLSYDRDFARVIAFYGGDTPVTEITEERVTAFAKSPHCLRKDMTQDGKPCAKPTIKKTLRLFKMYLEWLEATGRIEKAPIPKNLPMGSRSAAEKEKAAEERKAKAELARKEAEAAKAQAKEEKTKAKEAAKKATEPEKAVKAQAKKSQATETKTAKPTK